MKAKDVAAELMKNPEAEVCVWLGEPHDVWASVASVKHEDGLHVDFGEGGGYKPVDAVKINGA